MAEKKVMLTQDGYNKLVEKLEHLKTVRRLEVADRLKAAIALGDLSENSEYDDAKNEQAFIEGEILDLEAKINNSEIIQTESSGGIIDIGSTVVMREVEEIKTQVYAKVKKIYNIVDGEPFEINDTAELEKIYAVSENDFIEISSRGTDKEKIYKLTNITFEEISVNDKTDNIYRIIDGGFVKVDDTFKDADTKVYRIIDGESNELYGRIEKLYHVYQVVDENETYQIVGSTETNPDEAKISNESPVGIALKGKKVGSIAEVHAPVGIILYEVVEVK